MRQSPRPALWVLSERPQQRTQLPHALPFEHFLHFNETLWRLLAPVHGAQLHPLPCSTSYLPVFTQGPRLTSSLLDPATPAAPHSVTDGLFMTGSMRHLACVSGPDVSTPHTPQPATHTHTLSSPQRTSLCPSSYLAMYGHSTLKVCWG